MRVDFPEPECNCFHCHTSGTQNTHQEPGPSNVIAGSSSVSYQPVYPPLILDDDCVTNDPAVIASFSTSSPPIHSSAPSIKTGTLTSSNQNRNTTSSVSTSSRPPTRPPYQTNLGFSGLSGPKPPRTGSIQAPVQASTSFSSRRAQDFNKTASASGSKLGHSVGFASSDPKYVPTFSRKYPSSSIFPGFGVGYLPGAFSDPFGPSRRNSTGVERTLLQPSGYGASTTANTMFPSNQNIGSYQDNWNHGHKIHEGLRWEDYKQGGKGSRPNATSFTSIPDHPQRANFGKTGRNMTVGATTTPSSSSAVFSSNPNIGSSSQVGVRPNAAISGSGGGLRPHATAPPIYFPQSINERRNFGSRHENMTHFGSFPAGATTSSSSSSSVLGQTNASCTGFAPTLFPSSSSSPYNTTFPAASSTVQRPQETVVGSSGCHTACGAAPATTSSSASGYSTFNGATTTPPTAARSHNPMTFGTNLAAQGTTPPLQTYPMMYGTTLAMQGTTPGLQAYPMTFGTYPALQAYPMMFGTNLAAQGTSPTIQAHTVHVYIHPPFAAMNPQ